MRGADAADLGLLVAAMRRAVVSPRRLFLVAGTSHLASGWRDTVPCLELAGDPALQSVAQEAGETLGIDLVWESPEDIIPMPAHWEDRCRPADATFNEPGSMLTVLHFDPYSVVLRLVARGDEPDYVVALEYVRHGWVEMLRLEGLIAEMLPRMTSATLAQDPAEFRRKFKGLQQMVASQAAKAAAIGFTAATWA